jgi:hypothetical protein
VVSSPPEKKSADFASAEKATEFRVGTGNPVESFLRQQVHPEEQLTAAAG